MEILEIFNSIGLDYWYPDPKNLDQIGLFLPDLKIVWILLIQKLRENNYIFLLNSKIIIFNYKEKIDYPLGAKADNCFSRDARKIDLIIKKHYDFSLIPFLFHYPKVSKIPMETKS